MKIWIKIRRPLITGLLIYFFFLLQCTFFAALELGRVKPDIMIILTAAIGIIRGRKEGMLTGFFSGLLIDIQFGSILGLYALIYLVIGYANGYSRQLFFDEELKLPLLLIGGSDLLYGILVYLFQFLLRSEFQFLYFFSHIIVPQVIYTIIVAFGLYPLILFMNRKLAAEEKRGASKFV